MSSNRKKKPLRVLAIGDKSMAESYALSLSNFEVELKYLVFNWRLDLVSSRLTHAEKDTDLILLCGGVDINPTIYGDDNPDIMFSPQRDETECLVVDMCIGDVPILGICRGLQLLWAKTGGKLVHDIKQPHPSYHALFLREDWRWHDKEKNERRRVVTINSMHHQGLDLNREYAPGWEIIGTAMDGLPEVAINREKRIGGVQYHPECMASESAGRWVWDKIVKELVLK